MTRIVRVKFASDIGMNCDYAYHTDDDSVEVGDTVVVDSPSSGFTCVKVVSTQETVESIEKVSKWIVCKVDATAYQARKDQEERKAVLLAKLRRNGYFA